ncbi:MAG: hypothetical protein ACRDRT_10355 [Pseudonocardiaceae bacterium]
MPAQFVEERTQIVKPGDEKTIGGSTYANDDPFVQYDSTSRRT